MLLTGYLHAADATRRLANYGQTNPGKPLWELRADELLTTRMPDAPLPPFIWSKADCVALVKVYMYIHIYIYSLLALPVQHNLTYADVC